VNSFPWEVNSFPWEVNSFPWEVNSFPWEVNSFPWEVNRASKNQRVGSCLLLLREQIPIFMSYVYKIRANAEEEEIQNMAART
jgi:hypothetical protein